MSEKKKIAIVKPPLKVAVPYIDNPAFDFYAPNLVAYTLGLEMKDADIRFFDFFQEGEVVAIDEKSWRFGREFSTIDFADDFYDEIIVHYSCFDRAQGLRNSALTGVLDLLRNRTKRLVLADMFDSSLHYLSYEKEQALTVYPQVDEIYQRFFPFELYIQKKKYSILFDTASAEKYFSLLTRANQLNLIKDSNVSERIFPFLSSYGCPYNCSFCKEKADPWEAVAANQYRQQLLQLKQAGITKIYVMDPYANFNQESFEEFLSYCVTLGFKLHFTNGIGLKHINEKIASLLRQSIDQLYVSPESLLEKSLKKIRKPYSLELIESKLKLLHEFQIPVIAHFICQVPGESRSDINEMLGRIYRLHQLYNIQAFVQIYNDLSKLHITQERTANLYADFFVEEAGDLWLKLTLRNFQHQLNHKEHEKIIINATYKCNNRCSFCATGDRIRNDGSLNNQLQWIRNSYDKGIRLLDIDGGEPTLYPHLETLVQAAQNYDIVNITSNGRMFAKEEFLNRFLKYPNLRILISLHSSNKEIENSLVRSRLAHTETTAGILNCQSKLGDRFGVNTTVTSANFFDLQNTAEYLVKLGVRNFNLQWYTPFGIVDANLAPPREAIREIRALIYRFKEFMTIKLVNFVYCQAPDLESYMAQDYYKAVRLMMFADNEVVNLADYLAGRRYKTEECGRCAYNSICKGFWKYEEYSQPQHVYHTKGAVYLKENFWNTSNLLDEESILTKEAIEQLENKYSLIKHQNARPEINLLDIIPGYSCNRNCAYCVADESMRRINFITQDLFSQIDLALELYTPLKARIGGGEASIRKDFFTLLSFLRNKNIHQIQLQTNGLMLGYTGFLRRAIFEGVTEINISVAAHTEEIYDQLSQSPGSFANVILAIDQTLTLKVPLQLDVLLNNLIIDDLENFLKTYIELGVKSFNFWFAANEGKARRASEILPSMQEAAFQLLRVLSLETYSDLNLKIYYLPYCYLPGLENLVWNPSEENAYVITPGSNFFLQSGSIDLGVKKEACSQCKWQKQCIGIRPSYLAENPDVEVFPVIPEIQKNRLRQPQLIK